MLRTISPNISVITNWGCTSNCWYCVWKSHKLKNVRANTDWGKLERFLTDNRKKGKVSISGGGDCLNEYDKHLWWWINFLKITGKLEMLIDIHSRKKFINELFWKNHINRCVFSSDELENDIEYLEYLSKLTKIRIAHVVTSKTTDKMVEDYIDFSRKIGCQFTIKELFGFYDNDRYAQIKRKYTEVYYLDIGDYNIYYMPDNTITDTF